MNNYPKLVKKRLDRCIRTLANTKEILEFFKFDLKTPTASRVIQQRNKLKPEALLHLLHKFTATF